MSVLQQYEPYFQGWKSDAGKKPTTKEIKKVHDLGLARPGSKAAFALAMVARPEGATQPQIMQVLGVPHRNKVKEASQKKGVKIKREKDGNVVRIRLVA